MLLKDVIRSKICTIGQTSGFSLECFIRWARVADQVLLIELLDEIQADLDAEERHFKELAALVGGALFHQKLRQQWCSDCTRLRAYYQHNKRKDMSEGTMKQLKERIKHKICLIKMTPNYPLGDFVSWVEAEDIDIALLSLLLEAIQLELDNEARTLNGSQFPFSAQHQAIKDYWCLCCSQIHAYYKAIIRNPDCKKRLSFLLQGGGAIGKAIIDREHNS